MLILAFLGALLIIKPQLNLDIFPAIVGLIGAALSAGTVVSLRYLRSTDHPLVIVNYFGYTLCGTSFIILLWQGNFLAPDSKSIVALILLGILVLTTQISLTHAFQLVPVRMISPFLYLQIIFGTIFSLMIFKEIPDVLSISGAMIILISGGRRKLLRDIQNY